MVTPASRDVRDRMAGLACLPVKNPGRLFRLRCRLEQKESARYRIVLPRKGILPQNHDESADPAMVGGWMQDSTAGNLDDSTFCRNEPLSLAVAIF